MTLPTLLVLSGLGLVAYAIWSAAGRTLDLSPVGGLLRRPAERANLDDSRVLARMAVESRRSRLARGAQGDGGFGRRFG